MCRYRWTMIAWTYQYICVNLFFEGSSKTSEISQILFLLIKLVYLLRTPSYTIIKSCLTRISPRNRRIIRSSDCFCFLSFKTIHHVDYAPNSFITCPTYCIPWRP
ncbi:hypothetical protein MtrunA17_Chr3g0114421 [Medicago truncatula]|uniref:Uncharacterized protein n=1 Tax=Medicago truncatula TaxID=3880 RepID=A0A396IWT0_MEDTR|nr:hypothetical protein MtrunA17_Chr3g0114421 [Medicago truncatula]